MRLKHPLPRGLAVAVALLFVVLACASKSYTYPQYLSKARALGYPAENCSYCHKSPQGGTEWNERGRWLMEEKKRRQAEQVDMRWLKDYKPVASAGRDEAKRVAPARRLKTSAR
ncbi:MAG TPA: hypothetical protein VFZ44_14315 [Pyrinomonadaceae bacterium]